MVLRYSHVSRLGHDIPSGIKSKHVSFQIEFELLSISMHSLYHVLSKVCANALITDRLYKTRKGKSGKIARPIRSFIAFFCNTRSAGATKVL